MTAQLPATRRAFELACYTPEEARAIEDYWIAHMPEAGKPTPRSAPKRAEGYVGRPLAEVKAEADARRNMVASALATHGPMTSREVAEKIGAKQKHVSNDMGYLIKAGRVRKADDEHGGKYMACNSMARIARIVARRYRVQPSDLRGPRSDREVSWPRQIACAMARDLIGSSYPQIGEYFDRDHKTIMYGIQAVTKRRAEDPETEAEYQSLIKECNP